MYDPSLGRWITEDPIEFDGGDNNFYRFLKNDPVNGLDPSGLAELPDGLEVKKIKHPKPPFPFTPDGIRIGYRIKGAHRIEFIQFKQVSAKVTCTGLRKCKVLYEGYLQGQHAHGDQITTFSDPTKPVWELDRGFMGDSPVYLSFDFSALDGSESYSYIEDFPLIAEEGLEVFKNTVAKYEQALKRRYPTEGGVMCSVKVKATFRTYIIVDGKAVGHLDWSIETGSGPTVKGFAPGGMTDLGKDIIRGRYPDYPLPQ
jgi:hypothetical protein